MDFMWRKIYFRIYSALERERWQQNQSDQLVRIQRSDQIVQSGTKLFEIERFEIEQRSMKFDLLRGSESDLFSPGLRNLWIGYSVNRRVVLATDVDAEFFIFLFYFKIDVHIETTFRGGLKLPITFLIRNTINLKCDILSFVFYYESILIGGNLRCSSGLVQPLVASIHDQMKKYRNHRIIHEEEHSNYSWNLKIWISVIIRPNWSIQCVGGIDWALHLYLEKKTHTYYVGIVAEGADFNRRNHKC